MDGAFNFLEEWATSETHDVSNELLNLSDHSDYAMESTSDLMDWSSLFGAEENQSLFSDQKERDNRVGIHDFEDLLVEDGVSFASLSSEKDGRNIEIQKPVFQGDHHFTVPQKHSALQIQAAMQHIQTSQIQQSNGQPPSQLFIQHHQQPVQQIQLSQQQLQQMLPPQQQQQPLRISFQAAASTPVFPQSQQIILQPNTQSIHATPILLQQHQLQNPHAQVIISPQTHPFAAQQQICIPSNQKIQLVHHQQQQHQQQQQMFILNGSSSGNNFVNPSQIVLAPLPQNQQNSIIIQQQQVQPSMPNQPIMVQIGNQLFQLQAPVVEKNVACNGVRPPQRNGLMRIGTKQAIRRNSPSLVDGKSKPPAAENKPIARFVLAPSNSGRNVATPSSSGVALTFPAKFVAQSSTAQLARQQTTSTAFSCVLPTPVAKVRPLECKNGPSNKAISPSPNGLELLNGNQERSNSALDKTIPIQRQSFVNLKRSVPESGRIQISRVRIPISSSSMSSTPLLSVDSVPTLAVTSAAVMDLNSSASDSSAKPTSPASLAMTNLASSGGLASVPSKQSQLSKDFLKLSVGEKFKIHLMKDQKSALQPDTSSPFVRLRDSLGALASYHVFQTRCDDEARVSEAEEMYEGMSQDLISKKDRLLRKYQHIMLNRSMVHHDSVEDVMIERMFLVQEMSRLKEEKKLVQADPDSFIPRPVLPPEEMAALYPKDKEEDDDDDDACSSEGSIREPEENCDASRSEEERSGPDEAAAQAKHIVIKIKHCDGTFSASPAFKRPLEQDTEASDTSDKIPPIKIARIRLKRVDAVAEEKECDDLKGFFQVVENESAPKDPSSTPKTCSGMSGNNSKHAVTAVVMPFHKQPVPAEPIAMPGRSGEEVFPENKIPELQRDVRPSFLDEDASILPRADFLGSHTTNENEFNLLDDREAMLTGGYDRYEEKPDDYDVPSFVSGDAFSSGCRQPLDTPSLYSSNENQMFASDSEEFLDSNLEIEMQSAIQSILSHRTE